MKTTLLKGLSLAGLLLLTSVAMTTNAHSQSPQQCQQCQQCPPQQCETGRCRTCCHGCLNDCFYGCHNGACDDCCLHAIKKWAICPCYYILPPDYGWNVPTKVPVVRQGVTYNRYYPEAWYGTGSSQGGQYRTYPTVANPTDTTQLGYAYQQVPYWQPQPSRLPAPPVPSQWHVREGHRNLGYHGSYHNQVTPIHYHQPSPGVYMWSPQQSMEQAVPVPTPAPIQRPQAPNSVPPTPESPNPVQASAQAPAKAAAKLEAPTQVEAPIPSRSDLLPPLPEPAVEPKKLPSRPTDITPSVPPAENKVDSKTDAKTESKTDGKSAKKPTTGSSTTFFRWRR